MYVHVRLSIFVRHEVSGSRNSRTVINIIYQELGYAVFATVGAFYLPCVAMMIIYFKVFRAARARIHKKHFRAAAGGRLHIQPDDISQCNASSSAAAAAANAVDDNQSVSFRISLARQGRRTGSAGSSGKPDVAGDRVNHGAVTDDDIEDDDDDFDRKLREFTTYIYVVSQNTI